MILLDLFACEGLGGDGYAAAGWTVWGVELDRNHARNNPHIWFRGDFREGLERALATGKVDAIHASPPCQGHSATRCLANAQGKGQGRAVDLIPETRELLQASGLPYVIENVPRSPLDGVMLCGSSFGLQVQRHRIFESNVPLIGSTCRHDRFEVDPVSGKPRPWGVYGSWKDSIPSGGRTALSGAHARELMGVERRCTDRGLREALPPKFTTYIGLQLMAHIRKAAA